MSIVVPVYNREKLLVRCLESLYGQTYRPLHVIVVDNNSTDCSRQVALDWATAHADTDFRITVVDEFAKGASAARNRGLHEVTSDTVMFFDSDDELMPQAVSLAMEAFKSDPSADIVVWRQLIHTVDGHARLRKFARRNLIANHIVHSTLSTECYASRTSYMRRSGAWPAELPVWDDWELGVRLLLGHPRICFIEEILATVHCQEDSITGTSFHQKAGQWEQAIDLVEKAIERSSISEKDFLLRMTDYRRAILAAHYRREGKRDISTRLMRKTLKRRRLSSFQRLMLSIAYKYTSVGGRGASKILIPILR